MVSREEREARKLVIEEMEHREQKDDSEMEETETPPAAEEAV